MFREASNYAQQFKTIVRKLNRLLKDYEELNNSVQKLLESRAPRLYTIESDGSVGAELRDGDEFLGMGIQTEKLSSGSQSLHQRMTDEVLISFQNWLKSYDVCKSSLQSLSSLRFELDSRQRTVISLDSRRSHVENKIEKEGNEGGNRNERSVAAKDLTLRQTSEKLEHKEGKYNLCLKEFRQKEEELNQQLRSLLSEVSIMTELIGHLYKILTDSPQEIHLAFRGAGNSSPKMQISFPFTSSKVSKNVQDLKQSPIKELTDTSNPFLTPPS
eukprot:g1450.t1